MNHKKASLLIASLLSTSLIQISTNVYAAGVDLNLPENNSLQTIKNGITLEWFPVINSTAYRYLISTTPDFSNFFVDLLNKSYCSDTTTCFTGDTKYDRTLTSVTITNAEFEFQPNTTYYWKVRTNAPGVRDWSETRSFTTDGYGQIQNCEVYALNDRGRNNSQLLCMDLTAQTVMPIGSEHQQYDLEGLAKNPLTGELYTISSADSVFSPTESILYKISAETGALTAIGSTGFPSVDSLAFCSGVLFGWARGQGVVEIDLSTGLAIDLRSDDGALDIEGLSCTGEVLYASSQGILYSLDGRRPANKEIQAVCTNMPKGIETIEVLNNGSALYGSNNMMRQVQLSTCIHSDVMTSGEYDDIEGLSLNNAQCIVNTAPVDFLFVLDLSGSMTWEFAGSGSRLEAIQATLTSLNDAIASRQDDSRVAMVSFKERNVTEVLFDYTNDFDLANHLILTADPLGSTPMASGVKRGRELLAQSYDPTHRQVIVLISDGVPTFDLDGFGYDYKEVEAISLFDEQGRFLSPEQVKLLGRLDSRGRTAGMPLAEIMEELQAIFDVVDKPTIHSVALQPATGTDSFNDHILRYAAYIGNGSAVSATSLAELDDAFTNIAESTGTCAAQ